jgi:hypothetical protein
LIDIKELRSAFGQKGLQRVVDQDRPDASARPLKSIVAWNQYS